MINLQRPVRYMGRNFILHPFPWILITIFIFLTLLGISGSSMSIIDQSATGKAPGIILGRARSIRSDEWLVQHQETLAQKAANYPEINTNIGNGENMSMMLDVPFRGFYALFKPQNIFFFILPFSNAFAAKWWFLALSLCIGFYLLFIKLLPGKRLYASMGALLLLYNPFTQWWYLSGTLLSMAYGFWISYLIILIFDKDLSLKRLGLYTAGLAYFLISFIFLLYPPFQIPVALGIASLLIAFFWNRYINQRTTIASDKRSWQGFAVSILLTCVITGFFILTHTQIIHTVTNTAYPGRRSFVSGQYGNTVGNTAYSRLLSAPILGSLQSEEKFTHYFSNQSEAAVFIFINLVFTPIVLFHIFKKPNNKRSSAEVYFIGTSVMLLLFVIRMFTPLFNVPFKFLLLSNVQNERAEIGLIVLCCIQLVLLCSIKIKNITLKQALVTGLIATILFADSSLRAIKLYPGFMSPMVVILICLLLGISVFMLLRERLLKYGLLLFLIINVTGSIFVNPLYTRSEPKVIEELTNTIQENYKDTKTWAVMDSLLFENTPQIAGKRSVTGVFVYPQLKLWEDTLDLGHKETSDYNRYSHVMISSQKFPEGENFMNPQPDVLLIKFSCDNMKRLPNFGYLLTPTFLDSQTPACLKISRKISYPSLNLYIYEYVQQ